MGDRLLGIDFSGSADQWKAGRRKSNVWIAFGRGEGAGLRLDDLRPVQDLDGEGAPFDRLASLLARTEGFAGIDAPFSVPRDQAASAVMLWAEVARLPRGTRPFGKGGDLVAVLHPNSGPHGEKLYRACETVWRERGRLNVRSTLWCGPRGGAAFAAAAMTLLHGHKGPVWPVRSTGEGATLVEAYPAAQLVSWGLSPIGYNGAKPKAVEARRIIVEALTHDHGLEAGEEKLELCRANADALDAVLCAYAAKAISEGRHPRRLPSVARSEGWIVVDESGRSDAAAPLLGAAAEHRIRRLFDAVRDALEGEDEVEALP
jgi:hypothetical protein